MTDDDNRPIPTVAEMTGSDPDFTGAMTTEEYVRQMRQPKMTDPPTPTPLERLEKWVDEDLDYRSARIYRWMMWRVHLSTDKAMYSADAPTLDAAILAALAQAEER